ncbi:MAG: TIGR02757 family protein [Spirochaetales bacterium]|nr:TIGR02757 family protein [Spirochaetales bacterium]
MSTILEKQYSVYNDRKWVYSDPLQTIYRYSSPKDQEIVGFISAMCAYGRVGQILSSLDDLLRRTGPVYQFLATASKKRIVTAVSTWKHRFASGSDIAAFLWGLAKMMKDYGSLENAFGTGFLNTDSTIYNALVEFYKKLVKFSGLMNNHLLPDPGKKSACKRYHLFLRWMVRKDNIDPGLWKSVSPAVLLVPLDTHMHRVCRELGFTQRKQADQQTVFEVTESFRKFSPDDPVKYDFALTRSGIIQNNVTMTDCINAKIIIG